eukprot:TRINITY_DN54964_c0_g1_i1.p1 TRINITY_DN54964_c0_g1~~TRINITY_DN54964_c0_g1_i1.p1  ORF type:complete len:587 (+),score=67.70 TRINITY_DN54964_c0_g1_i1:125-1885(+)
MSRPAKGISFDLTAGYVFKNNVGSGGFGHVCAAFDTQRVLQHKYTGDGERSTFKVVFRHLKVEDQKYVRVLVDGKAVNFMLKLPPNDVWPLIVTLEAPPPKGASVTIQSNDITAIKRVTEVFTDLQHSKYALRELKLLKFFNHENIIGLRDAFLPPHAGNHWNDIYIVNDLMDNNLRQVVKSDQPISKYHASYFMYQIFCGLKQMHDADIIHRDLKPHNVLVNQDCTVKICDFGMARMEDRKDGMTEEVQTIWYRAPEILMDCDRYSKPIDMWACGTILGELLVRKALFMGKHARHMLQLIVQLLGTISQEDVDIEQTSTKTRKFVLEQRAKQIDWRKWCPSGDSSALDLISNLLCFNPHKRFTIEEALNHPFSQIWVECEEEGSGIPDPLHKLQIPNPTPQRQQLTQVADAVASACDNPALAANPMPLAQPFQQIAALMPDMGPVMAARWGFNGQTFAAALQPHMLKYIKHFALSLHARPLPGETVQFNAAFEEQFRGVPPHLEEQAMRRAAELIKEEIMDFHKTHRATSGLSGPPELITASSGRMVMTVDTSHEEDVTIMELSAVPSTPVAPVSGTSWEDAMST